MSLPPKIKPSAIVNAYLFYAQRLLQFDVSPQHMSQEVDKRVLTASVCLCLKQAWQAWLDELGRYLNKSLTSYTDCLLPAHRTHPEIEALLSLQKQPESWFSQLLLCLEPIVQAAPSETQTEMEDEDLQHDQAVRSGRIQVRQLEQAVTESAAAHIPEDAEAFMTLINAFRSYIRSVRIRQEEW